MFSVNPIANIDKVGQTLDDFNHFKVCLGHMGALLCLPVRPLKGSIFIKDVSVNAGMLIRTLFQILS